MNLIDRLRKKNLEIIFQHVKRNFNSEADYLTNISKVNKPKTLKILF